MIMHVSCFTRSQQGYSSVSYSFYLNYILYKKTRESNGSFLLHHALYSLYSIYVIYTGFLMFHSYMALSIRRTKFIGSGHIQFFFFFFYWRLCTAGALLQVVLKLKCFDLRYTPQQISNFKWFSQHNPTVLRT